MRTTVREADRELRRLGYKIVRQRGSHMIYQHPVTGFNVVVPSSRGLQGGELRIAKFMRLLNQAREGAQSAP